MSRKLIRAPAISVARGERSALVAPAGDQDLQAAGTLDRTLSRLVEERVAVPVDMTRVTRVDPTVPGVVGLLAGAPSLEAEDPGAWDSMRAPWPER